MALAALDNYEFPYKHGDPADAARKIFRRLSRNLAPDLLLHLDEYWFFFRQYFPYSITELPKFIIKALCTTPTTNEHIVTLAAFTYANNIDKSFFTNILDLKYPTADEEFTNCLDDFEEDERIRNIVVTYSLSLGHRVNLNNVPLWLVDLQQDKENIPPFN